MKEPSIGTLRNHNRRQINRYYDQTIPPQLHSLRHDLMIQGCDPVSRADQVAAVHQVLRRCRATALAAADDFSERGYRINSVTTDERNMLVINAEKVRSSKTSIEHDVSEPRGGESIATKNMLRGDRRRALESTQP